MKNQILHLADLLKKMGNFFLVYSHLLGIVEWEKTARTLKFKNCCNFGTPYFTYTAALLPEYNALSCLRIIHRDPVIGILHSAQEEFQLVSAFWLPNHGQFFI
jgi:hypothetical protein